MTPRGLNQKGFTIIELIVVFSIIAVLSVIGVAVFVNYGRIQILESASSDLSSALLVAKSRAISQVNTVCKDKEQILNGYQVVLFTSENRYELQVVCSTNFTYRISSTTLPKNVTFSPFPTSASFFFQVISSGVAGSGTISLSAYGNVKIITVDPIGGIQTQ